MCGGGGCNSNPNTRLFSSSSIFRTDKDAAFPGPNGTNLVRRGCASIPLKILHLRMILYYIDLLRILVIA